MENLKEFQLKNEEIKNVNGGLLGPHTKTRKETSIPDSGCVMVTTDDYDDANGNGTWDDGEWGSTQNPVMSC